LLPNQDAKENIFIVFHPGSQQSLYSETEDVQNNQRNKQQELLMNNTKPQQDDHFMTSRIIILHFSLPLFPIFECSGQNLET